jgi:hypothetical protein
MKFLEASQTKDEMSLCAVEGVSEGGRFCEFEVCCVRLSISSTLALLRLSQNRISPSLPAVATTLFGASFARSKHVTLLFTEAITPSGRRSAVKKRNESSDDIDAS